MSVITDLPDGVEWLHDETTEEFDWDTIRCEASFVLPWTSRLDFLNVARGLDEVFTIGAVSYTRRIPLQYPFYPSVYAHSVRLRGEGSSRLAADGKSIEYDYAFAAVQFRTPTWQYDSPYPLVTENMDTTADMCTIPGTALVFPSDGLPLNQNVGIRVPVTEFTLTFHQVRSFDKALYASLAGRVNSLSFYDYAAGEVLYDGPATNGVIYSNNLAAWTITHRFRRRAIPHNVIMRPDGAGYEAPVWASDDTKYLLETADLNALWAA